MKSCIQSTKCAQSFVLTEAIVEVVERCLREWADIPHFVVHSHSTKKKKQLNKEKKWEKDDARFKREKERVRKRKRKREKEIIRRKLVQAEGLEIIQ